MLLGSKSLGRPDAQAQLNFICNEGQAPKCPQDQFFFVSVFWSLSHANQPYPFHSTVNEKVVTLSSPSTASHACYQKQHDTVIKLFFQLGKLL